MGDNPCSANSFREQHRSASHCLSLCSLGTHTRTHTPAIQPHPALLHRPPPASPAVPSLQEHFLSGQYSGM